MKFLALLFLGAGLSQSQAVPKAHRTPVRDNQGKQTLPACTHDNLYRSFLDNRYSLSASAFCSNYITETRLSTTVAKTTIASYVSVTDAASAVTAVVSATPTTTTGSAMKFVSKAKHRGVPAAFAPGRAGTYPPNQISSACSCLVSPLVMVRQLATGTSTSTQTWTRHFTRLTAVIESTTSTANIAAASSTAVSVDSALETSVPVTSPDSPDQLSPAVRSDSASTTSFAAASTTTFFAAASTSTVETILPAAYCSGGDIYLFQTFAPQCGVSYIPETPDPSTINTVGSYMDCAMLCANIVGCQAYSYLLTAIADNCYVFALEQSYAPYADPNVDSGVLDD